MDYQNLPERIKKILKLQNNGNVALCSNREMMSKRFAFFMLFPGLASAVMAAMSEAGERIFFLLAAGLILGITSFLFGRKSRLEFDQLDRVLYLKSTLWGRFEKSRSLASFETMVVKVSPAGVAGPFQVKLANQLFEFDSVEDVKGFTSFLAVHYKLRVVESFSNSSNENLKNNNLGESHIRLKENQDDEIIHSLSNIKELNVKDLVFIEIWDAKAVMKFFLPFFVFTAVAGIIKYGVF